MSDLVQPQQGKASLEVSMGIQKFIWFADSKYGEVLPHPHAQAQAVQGAMDLKKRPEAGNQSQAETGKLNQVNLGYCDFLSASFGHGWKANIC